MGLDGVIMVLQILAYRLIKVTNKHNLPELLRKEPQAGRPFSAVFTTSQLTTGY